MLAGALFLASVVEVFVVDDSNGSPQLLLAVTAVTTTSLVWRRAAPGLAIVGSVAGLLLPVALGTQADDAALLVTNLLAMHAINAYGSRRAAVVGSTSLMASVMASIMLATSRTAGDLQWAFLLYVLAAGAGQVMSRQARANRIAVVTAERAAVAQERRSVAADLHDVIAHGLALMVVQAGAAAAVMDSDPAKSKELLNGVQEAGERAAAELHHLLTVLAPDGKPAPPGPAPGLTELTSLAEAARSGGTALELRVVGDPTCVPDGLSRACYRIVQEALTNAIKHAPGSSVSATVAIDGEHLEVLVDNTPGTIGHRPSVPGGHGLVAMRERAALFGGTLSDGPTQHGWRTSARFPLDHDGRASL